jgi:hypothetical protein
MFYEAGNKTYGSSPPANDVGEYNVMALARSNDNGHTWKRQGIVISGTDPKPTSAPAANQPGVGEPGIVVANGYIYMVYLYHPNSPVDLHEQGFLQIARAPVESDGAPGAWRKYYNGAWGQPGVGGKGSTILPIDKASGINNPAMVWPVFSTYLNAFVLVFLANAGWFFSTSTDLIAWTQPMNFMPMKMWQTCQPMDWNFIFVTPGKPGGVIDQTGYVLYAHTDHKGETCDKFYPHELWVRPFTFTKGP